MSLDATAAGLIGALIGGGSSVIAVAVTSSLERRDERRKWLRDKK